MKVKKTCEIKINIKGHSKYINKALFCKNDDKQVVSYSKESNEIKIWNIESLFCIGSIQINKQIKNIIFFKEHLFYQEENECICIYDPVKLIQISTIKIELEGFFVIYENNSDLNNINKYDIIIYDKNSLMLNSDINKKLTFQDKKEKIFYDNDFKIIYIFFSSYLEIIKANIMEILFKLENEYKPKFFIDNQINNKFICGNFIYRGCELIKIYSFVSKNIYNPEKIKALIISKPDFFGKRCSLISNIQSLSLNNNIDIETSNIDFRLKNYLNDEKIKKELFSNFDKNLKQKRLEVSNKIKNFKIDKNDLENNYLEFIKMLIKDNTNKDLVIKYLNYLKKYGNNIKYKFIEKFIDEYNYYKIIFEDKE